MALPDSLIEWFIRFAMLPIAATQHRPVVALAWLIFIFCHPWIGLALYALMGHNLLVRRRLKDYCERIQEVRSMHRPAFFEPHLFVPPDEIGGLRLAELTRNLVCMPILRGNTVELMDDGYHVVDRLLADFKAARHHIHILFYIFKNDSVGRKVAEALAEAASRGVSCRVLVDAFGSRDLNGGLAAWMRDRGVELHTLMPVNPFRRHLTRFDLRNHRKLVVIDGELGYTGSQNIEDKPYDHGCAEAWHDLMVRVEGPGVLEMQLVFLEDWYYATKRLLGGPELLPLPGVKGDVPLQALPSGPADPTNTVLRDILIEAIHGARESVIITSPYFIPDESFLLSVRLAAFRGVRVELIMPRHADHPVVGAVARAFLDDLLAWGVSVYFHRGILHAKTMSIDTSIALIGTANFDRRSFFLHSEMSLLFYGRDITNRLRAKQAEYKKQSDPLDLQRWKRRSRLRRLRDHTAKLLSPLL